MKHLSIKELGKQIKYLKPGRFDLEIQKMKQKKPQNLADFLF